MTSGLPSASYWLIIAEICSLDSSAADIHVTEMKFGEEERISFKSQSLHENGIFPLGVVDVLAFGCLSGGASMSNMGSSFGIDSVSDIPVNDDNGPVPALMV